MANPSAVRRASAVALTALLVACGETHTTGLDDFRAPTPQFNAVELLITFMGGGSPGTTGSNPPSFSLATVPTTGEAETAWSRTIAIDPHGPFAPDMAVDYGDGAGPQNLNVSQSGGATVINPITGAVTQEPISYSFTLSRTYATPGTYTITVVAATYADGTSSRYATATITVGPNLNVYIQNFQIATPVIQSQPAAFSFDAVGPAGPNYAVTLKFGTNLTVNAFVPANGSYSDSYAWPAPGTYEMQVVISSGDRSATLTRQVVVEAAPVVISAFVGPDNVSFGEEATYSFRADGPGPGPYTAEIRHGDGDGMEPTVIPITPGVTVTRTHTWAQSGLWNLSIVVNNGFVADTLREKVPIYRPRPTVDDLSIPDTLYFNQESVIYFVPNDPGNIDVTYKIIFSNAEGESADVQSMVASGAPVRFDIGAPDFDYVIWISIVVSTILNGLIVESDTARHTLTTVDLVCPAGSYRDGFACVEAPSGSYVPEAGALEATPCPVGTYQDQAGQTSCIPAPAGSFVPVSGATQASPCPAGSWQDQPGSAACNPAPAGHFAGQAGATQATACAPGTYQPASGQTGCLDAAPGSYASTSGATQATPCAPGTYQPASGSTSCYAAAPGSYVSSSGATQAALCAPGTYQPASGQTGCLEAPVGSYVDFAGAAAATLCPATTSTTGTGSTSAADCIPLGQVALLEIEEAVSEGALVAAIAGNGGQQQFSNWVASLERAFQFLEGPQRQAGCSAVRHALAQADGDPETPDMVTGPARADVEAALRRILTEYGC